MEIPKKIKSEIENFCKLNKIKSLVNNFQIAEETYSNNIYSAKLNFFYDEARVKKILQEAVENEDKAKPLTDEKLTTLLKDKGYNIARRTVAKYREQLNIPVARLRKEL